MKRKSIFRKDSQKLDAAFIEAGLPEKVLLGAPVFVNVQEVGLYTGSNGEWTGKADPAIPPVFNNLRVSEVDSAVIGQIVSGGLSLVPEPSLYALFSGLCAALYLVVRRRV